MAEDGLASGDDVVDIPDIPAATSAKDKYAVPSTSFLGSSSRATVGWNDDVEGNEGVPHNRKSGYAGRKTYSMQRSQRYSTRPDGMRQRRSHARRQSADLSEIRAVGSVMLDDGVESAEFQEYIANRISYANAIQDGKLSLTSFKEFSAGVGIQPWWLFYSDEEGKVVESTETEYVEEWWKMVTYWLKKIIMVAFCGHVSLIFYSYYITDPIEDLRVIRALIRGVVFLVIGISVGIVGKLNVFQKRRMVSFILGFYLYVGVIIIDRQNLPILLKDLGLVPCDYHECLIATNPNECVPNALPYVVAQASIAVTIFRLPFIHVLTLVIVLTTLYVGTSLVLGTNALKEVTTASWELCPLCLAFYCLQLSSRRGELLSRFLFMHSKVNCADEKNAESGGEAGINRANSTSSLESGPSSPSGSACGAEKDMKPSIQRQLSRKFNNFLGMFVVRFFSKTIFMSFENKIMRSSDAMCWQTIEFYNPEMEFCFLTARLRVSNKYAMYSMMLIVAGYGYLTFDDIRQFLNPSESAASLNAGELESLFIMRLVLRGVFFVVATISILINAWLTDIYFRSLCLLFGTFLFLVINLVSDPQVLEFIVGVSMCDGQESTVCANRMCFSILAVLTAEFSWVLVQLRMKFHHVWATLLSVCVVFVVLRIIGNLPLGAAEFFCLLVAAICFTIGAYRIDVTARALFFIEWEKEDDKAEKEQTKILDALKPTNVLKIAQMARKNVTSVLQRSRNSQGSDEEPIGTENTVLE